MNDTELIIDKDAFLFLSGECKKIINTQKRLPDFVFQRSFTKYFVIEYNHIYGEDFGSFLFQISNIFGDEFVNYMVLDPDPGDSYYKHFSYFGLASFKPSNLVERYRPVMHREQNVPKFLASANVGAFWGSSLKWGIFCDRISWEIAVIALTKDIDVPRISGFRCMDTSQLSACINNDYSWKPAVASDFNKRFFANYPIL